MTFTSPIHEERFANMVRQEDMSPYDIERASLFFILTGNDDLYGKRNYIYSIEEHGICMCLESSEVDFSSSAQALIRLGFNLYNGWSDEFTTPMSIFGYLDSRNLLLAKNAVKIRFQSRFWKGMQY
jgi:hypothetical protein